MMKRIFDQKSSLKKKASREGKPIVWEPKILEYVYIRVHSQGRVQEVVGNTFKESVRVAYRSFSITG